jgi:hypothetical protein
VIRTALVLCALGFALAAVAQQHGHFPMPGSSRARSRPSRRPTSMSCGTRRAGALRWLRN